MKQRAVHFDNDGYARVMVNPSPELLSLPNTLLNPDMNAVVNTPIEHWKLVDGMIRPMDDTERASRDLELTDEIDPTWTHVVQNTTERLIFNERIVYKTPTWLIALLILEALIICFLALKLI